MYVLWTSSYKSFEAGAVFCSFLSLDQPSKDGNECSPRGFPTPQPTGLFCPVSLLLDGLAAFVHYGLYQGMKGKGWKRNPTPCNTKHQTPAPNIAQEFVWPKWIVCIFPSLVSVFKEPKEKFSSCVCVCVCRCLCVCLHMCMSVCILKYMSACVHEFVCVCIYIYLWNVF